MNDKPSAPAPEENLPAPITAALATAKEQLATFGGCALLIGVEAYPAYEGKDLLAGRNDVMAYWKVCRRLGYRPAHIRVYTSPKLTKEDILRAELELAPELAPKEGRAKVEARVEQWFSGAAPLSLEEATAAKITEGIAWLSASLVFTVKLTWESTNYDRELTSLPGFLAYSGHGARISGDLALCPSDTRFREESGALENALPFATLREMLDAGDDLPGGYAPTDNLTVVLDCCFAAAGDERRSARVSTLTPGAGGEGKAARGAKTEIGSRVFCSSGRDEPSYQAMLGGHWHGAFTWAFTRALEQWKTAPSGISRRAPSRTPSCSSGRACCSRRCPSRSTRCWWTRSVTYLCFTTAPVRRAGRARSRTPNAGSSRSIPPAGTSPTTSSR